MTVLRTAAFAHHALALALALSLLACGGDTVVLDATVPSDMVVVRELMPATPSCTDAVKNGSETDVDCGGGTCPACGTGLLCGAAKDCTTGVCKARCQSPSCVDGVQNGVETDIDCGGGMCPRCPDGKKCVAPSDCLHLNCKAMACAP